MSKLTFINRCSSTITKLILKRVFTIHEDAVRTIPGNLVTIMRTFLTAQSKQALMRVVHQRLVAKTRFLRKVATKMN
jgi:hypothetical protein